MELVEAHGFSRGSKRNLGTGFSRCGKPIHTSNGVYESSSKDVGLMAGPA